MIRIQIYKDAKGEFRSRIISSNGKIRFDSGEGYKHKTAAERSIQHLIRDCIAGSYVIQQP
jgi:uncharacterized protein YegP (UPF0339 family)